MHAVPFQCVFPHQLMLRFFNNRILGKNASASPLKLQIIARQEDVAIMIVL